MLAQLTDLWLRIETGGALKRMPRAFESHADHRHADLLRQKSFIVRRALTQADWKGGAVVDAVVTLAEHAQPLLRF